MRKVRDKKKQFLAIKSDWSGCVKCSIGIFAYKHVLYSGPLSARVVFIGEGPGKSEDTIGQAFVGRAGRLLKIMVSNAGIEPKTCGYTNLVACRPCDKREGPNRAPEHREVVNCRPRLLEILRVVQPKHVVLLGRVPARQAPKASQWGHPAERVHHLPHPAYILRLGGEKCDEFHEFSKKLKEVVHG